MRCTTASHQAVPATYEGAVEDACVRTLRARRYPLLVVNGSHTLPNPVVEGEQTKVRLIEEAFHQAMWATEGQA